MDFCTTGTMTEELREDWPDLDLGHVCYADRRPQVVVS